jgi:hypothetical protein
LLRTRNCTQLGLAATSCWRCGMLCPMWKSGGRRATASLGPNARFLIALDALRSVRSRVFLDFPDDRGEVEAGRIEVIEAASRSRCAKSTLRPMDRWRRFPASGCWAICAPSSGFTRVLWKCIATADGALRCQDLLHPLDVSNLRGLHQRPVGFVRTASSCPGSPG